MLYIAAITTADKRYIWKKTTKTGTEADSEVESERKEYKRINSWMNSFNSNSPYCFFDVKIDGHANENQTVRVIGCQNWAARRKPQSLASHIYAVFGCSISDPSIRAGGATSLSNNLNWLASPSRLDYLRDNYSAESRFL